MRKTDKIFNIVNDTFRGGDSWCGVILLYYVYHCDVCHRYNVLITTHIYSLQIERERERYEKERLRRRRTGVCV